MRNKGVIFAVTYSFRPKKVFWRKLFRNWGWKLLESFGHTLFQVIMQKKFLHCTKFEENRSKL